MARSHVSQRVVVGVFVVIVLLATIPGLAAAETSIGSTIVIERGETLSDDLTTAAGTVIILGTVDGDVTALAGDVVVSGEVTGDVTAVAGRVEVTGQVGGTLTALGGVTFVNGSVADDLDSIGGALSVSGEVSGSVDVISVLVDVEDGALIEGQLRTTAVRTQVNGTVLGGAGTVNQSAVESPASLSTGDSQPHLGNAEPSVEWWSPQQAPVALASTVVAVPTQVVTEPVSISFLDAYGFLVNVLLGVVLVGLLPRFSTRVASLVIRDPVQTGVFGLVTTIAVPVVLVLLGLSLFGLPLALAGGAVFLVVWWVGAILGRFAIGVWILGALPQAFAYANVEIEPVENRWASLLVGLVVVALLTAIPFIGSVLDVAVSILGVGALVRMVYTSYSRTERGTATDNDSATSTGKTEN